MSEGNEEARIIAAKSRITKFTLDNKHLTFMIERLKKEIQIVEANKEKLLSDLQNPAHSEIEDRENNSHTQESDLFIDKSPINASDTSDSIVSSTDSELNLSEDTSSEDSSLTKNIKDSQSIDSSHSILLDCTSCVESLLSNLEVVKKCLRANHCLDCTQLRNCISSKQETNFDKRQHPNTNPLNSITSSLYSILSFMSLPFIVVLLFGYFGALVCAKQANSYLVSAPPQ